MNTRQTCDLATPSLTFYYFYTRQTQKDVSCLFKDQIRTEHWGRRRATRWRLWGSRVDSPQLKIPVSDMWGQEFDVRDSSQIIPAFLLIVYRLCPLLLITEPSMNPFFIYKYICIAWTFKRTSVVFLISHRLFFLELSILLLHRNSFKWQNTVTWIIQARTLCLLVCDPVHIIYRKRWWWKSNATKYAVCGCVVMRWTAQLKRMCPKMAMMKMNFTALL